MSDDKVLVLRGQLEMIKARAEVFDDGSDGADAESARSVSAIIDDLLAQPSDGALTNEANQCDGCRAGKPLENGNRHRMGKEGGYSDFMSCTSKLYKAALTNEGAEQMARMPVDRSYDVRAKMIIAFNERKKTGGDLDDCLDAAYKSALRFTPSPVSTESRS